MISCRNDAAGVTRCWRLKYRYSSWRNAFDLINGDHMTERQQRLQLAGARLIRGAALIGGGVGFVLFLTVLTGQQRLVLVFLVGALAMPAVILVLALSKPVLGGAPGLQRRVTRRDAPYFLGAAFANALIFVQAGAYLALVTVIVTGLLLIGGVRVAAAVGQRG